MVQLVYNSSTHSGIKISLFQANYGFQPRMDYHLNDRRYSRNPQADKMMLEFDENLTILREELKKQQEKMKIQADKNRIEGPILKEGDKVYLNRKNLRTKRPSDKLDFKKTRTIPRHKKDHGCSLRTQPAKGITGSPPVQHLTPREGA